MTADIDDNTAAMGDAAVTSSAPAVGTSRRRVGRIAFVSFAITSIGACGGAPAPDLHAAFASIEVDEARIEHASLALETAVLEDARRAQSEEVCSASAHLCDTARPLDDRDANTRCRRAEERCGRVAAETSAR